MKTDTQHTTRPTKSRKSTGATQRRKRKLKGKFASTQSRSRSSSKLTARRKQERKAKKARHTKKSKHRTRVKRYVSSTFNELRAVKALDREKKSKLHALQAEAPPLPSPSTVEGAPISSTNDTFLHEPILLPEQEPPQSTKQTLGVNLFGFCYAEMGIGQALRLGAMACSEAGVPTTLHNYPLLKTTRQQDYSLLGKLAEAPKYGVNLVYFNPDILEQVISYFSQDTFRSKYTIGYWHWELPVAPPEFDAAFKHVNEIWVPSEFVRAAIAERSPVPVYTMPHGITTEPLSPYNRSSFGIPEDHTVFLTMFDTYSITERKNPAAVIHAFNSAFQYDEKVHLVIKGLCPENGNESYQQLEQIVKGHPQMTLLTEPLSRQETLSLIACSDAYVSLHRAEGFGLCCAEAMMLGKPVIATNWSGNTEYMTADNSYLVPFSLTAITNNYGPYTAGQMWAEPSVVEAARYMRTIHDLPNNARSIGAKAQADMQQHYSLSAAGNRMRQRLEQIIQS
ncbi:glycosyltransferase family 4 protein [Paenibacillus arenosi]|uniref:Glycosyltransferase family 4 protein n=1 Tax=Paenibacillus arenosi TaxID=2774142 RepID=A0ABR9AXC3_9BACL|nr:glycosyltransferase family 4 protein [Paenibacillus arenosi]MBD8498734.1 glycosyltransferase family 4 protein [Paenibacillus arenosi]